MKKSEIAVTEKPSLVVKTRLTKFEKDAITDISGKLGVTFEEASEIVKSEPVWNEIMGIKEKAFKLMLLEELGTRITEAANRKIDSGSLEQLKHAITALAIVKEKVFDSAGKQTVNIGGKNVQINLGFKFKPYGKSDS